MSEQVVPILRVADATEAVVWYGRLGFVQEWEHRFEPELPAFVCIARGTMHLFLSEHLGDARPGTSLYLWMDDVWAVGKEFGVVVDEQPWAHEFYLNDPDGNRLRIGTRK